MWGAGTCTSPSDINRILFLLPPLTGQGKIAYKSKGIDK